MSEEHYTFGPWGSEVYTFAFSQASESVVFQFAPEITVEQGADVQVAQTGAVVESYSFFWPGIEINEFQSGAPGVGIPEVFSGNDPATLVFTPVTIAGEEVYEMEVTAS